MRSGRTTLAPRGAYRTWAAPSGVSTSAGARVTSRTGCCCCSTILSSCFSPTTSLVLRSASSASGVRRLGGLSTGRTGLSARGIAILSGPVLRDSTFDGSWALRLSGLRLSENCPTPYISSGGRVFPVSRTTGVTWGRVLLCGREGSTPTGCARASSGEIRWTSSREVAGPSGGGLALFCERDSRFGSGAEAGRFFVSRSWGCA